MHLGFPSQDNFSITPAQNVSTGEVVYSPDCSAFNSDCTNTDKKKREKKKRIASNPVKLTNNIFPITPDVAVMLKCIALPQCYTNTTTSSRNSQNFGHTLKN